MTREMLELCAVLGMAAVTYLTRAAGFALAARLPDTGRVRAFLSCIPGAILAAIVAPAALASGPAEALATGVTAVTAALTRNIPLSMAVGVGTVWTLRRVF